MLSVLAVVAIILQKKKTRYFKDWTHREYREKQFLMSENEMKFFNALKKIVSTNETIFAKVRQADILEPNYTQKHPAFWSRFNRISQRHVDFVLCDKTTSRILTVIEINDKSHQRPDRVKRDWELRQALRETSIRLFEIPAKSWYDPTAIRTLIYGNENSSCAPTKNANEPIKNQRQPFSQSALSVSNGKRTHVDKDITQQPMQPEQKAHLIQNKPFPNNQVSQHPDARYMPH